MGEILDSGNRTEFESGAVRDMQGEDKGRCDLMPLDVVCELFRGRNGNGYTILSNLETYKKCGHSPMLLSALCAFIDEAFGGSYTTAMLELSVHFRDGAEKYGENNWQKGLPEWSYISSAVRHYLKWHRGDRDERHDRAFMWNIVCLIWTIENKESESETQSVRQKDVLEGGSCG